MRQPSTTSSRTSMPSVSRRRIGPRTTRVRRPSGDRPRRGWRARRRAAQGRRGWWTRRPRPSRGAGVAGSSGRLQPGTVAVVGAVDRARDPAQDGGAGEPLDRAEDRVRWRRDDHRRIALDPARGRDGHPDGARVDRGRALGRLRQSAPRSGRGSPAPRASAGRSTGDRGLPPLRRRPVMPATDRCSRPVRRSASRDGRV